MNPRPRIPLARMQQYRSAVLCIVLGHLKPQEFSSHQVYTLGKKATIRQVTTMLSSKTILPVFSGHNGLPTTSADDPTL